MASLYFLRMALCKEVSIKEYYIKKIEPLSPLFKDIGFSRGRNLAVCCFHEDTDASMGVFNDKSTGKELYRCFGCQSVGDVVDMHMRVEKKFHGVILSEQQAIYEVAELFGVTLNEEQAKQLEERRVNDKQALLYAPHVYGHSDFKDDIIDFKLSMSDMSDLEFALGWQELRDKAGNLN